MSLTSQVVDGLIAVNGVLPANPLITTTAVTATAALVIAAGWSAANPARMAAGDGAALTPGGSPRRSATVEQASVAPLEIPLDVVPKDDQGRTPFDIVGADAIRAVVDQFYSKLCADPTLGHFFHHIDMAALKRHQALFIGQLWGGPVHYPLDRLKEAHADLHISPEEYWRVCGHLMVTLTHVQVPDWIAVFTMTRLYQARSLVITETTGATAIVAPAPEA